jgi:hypothetical protein
MVMSAVDLWMPEAQVSRILSDMIESGIARKVRRRSVLTMAGRLVHRTAD